MVRFQFKSIYPSQESQKLKANSSRRYSVPFLDSSQNAEPFVSLYQKGRWTFFLLYVPYHRLNAGGV